MCGSQRRKKKKTWQRHIVHGKKKKKGIKRKKKKKETSRLRGPRFGGVVGAYALDSFSGHEYLKLNPLTLFFSFLLIHLNTNKLNKPYIMTIQMWNDITIRRKSTTSSILQSRKKNWILFCHKNITLLNYRRTTGPILKFLSPSCDGTLLASKYDGEISLFYFFLRSVSRINNNNVALGHTSQPSSIQTW